MLLGYVSDEYYAALADVLVEFRAPDGTATVARSFSSGAVEADSIPGDYATVDGDGTVTLLGRGSVVINAGGEKVFPEEVEEALKLHPAVDDAVVVGVPDERFGEAVTAVVSLRPAARATPEDLAAGDLAADAVAAFEPVGGRPQLDRHS